MLGEYSNQFITLKVKGVVDAFNQATFATSTIAGRFQEKITMVRNAQGQLVTSTSQIFTASVVKADDKIVLDGLEIPIITVEKIRNLEGQILWYEVYM